MSGTLSIDEVSCNSDIQATLVKREQPPSLQIFYPLHNDILISLPSQEEISCSFYVPALPGSL